MQKLRFLFLTKLEFSSMVGEHHFILRCVPQVLPEQQVVDLDMKVMPQACEGMFSIDSFGNQLYAGRETVRIDSAGLRKQLSHVGGFVHFALKVGDYVDKGTVVGQIFDPFTAECLEELKSPCSGQLFYVRSDCVAVSEHELMFSVTPIEQVVVI